MCKQTEIFHSFTRATKPPFQSSKPLEPANSYKFLIYKELESVNFLKSFFC
jgi:hypothetical protein